MAFHDKPIVHIFMDESTGAISISAHAPDDEQYETNHIILHELRNGNINTHGSVINVLRNVLEQIGCQVTED